MNTKRIILSGVVAGIIIFLIGNISYFASMGLYETQTTDIWKPMKMPVWMGYLFTGNLMMGLLMAVVYSYLQKALSGNAIKKGAAFGVLVWLAGSLPQFIGLYLTVAMSDALLLSWIIQYLISNVAAGISIAYLYKE
ncbi:MAG: hypothetical protein A7316_01915 [Candidatus Altiarchaeales archaeon WOR_SM1_86-2]|nr:MAG: hypothetical protein A7315_14785 [Candidatus Altiarchaeales archaeon WOR_SM1_79]ODS37301.1 MAG: hypothetical protein A7316_01915 [Candidatus Altiarchaeales archaeon WOR_SM1_86-2]